MSMELTVPLISLPAIIALVLKAGVYTYIRLFSVIRNLQAKLFLFLLLAFAVQNLAEVAGFYAVNVIDTSPYIPGKVYFSASIMIIAILFHLSFYLALNSDKRFHKVVIGCVYSIAGVLEILLLFTPWLVKDFGVFDYHIGLTMTRIPGPLYVLFELYVMCVFLSVIAISTYGSRKQDTAAKRTQNSVLLIAIIPTAAIAMLVIGLMHFGFKWINSTATLPIAVTYFLIVMTYAIHNRRFLDSDSEFSLRARQQLSEAQQHINSLQQFLQKTVTTLDSAPDNKLTAQNSPNEKIDDAASKKSFEEQIVDLEMRLIREALERCGGNQANAARLLGLRPNTLHYKMKRYGIS